MQNVIRNSFGERLDSSFHPARAGSDGPLLVLGHGVTGNKDRPFLVTLAELASAAGVDTLRFSFAGNGASEGRFEDCTLRKQVGDLSAVLDSIGERPVIYAGHSLGGAVGVLAAAADERIRYLISMAGMVHTQRFVERKFADLVPGRDCMWEKPECPLSRAFLDDMREVGSVLERAPLVRVPWLLLHGDADTVVPFEESLEILERAGGPKRLCALEGVDHVFSDGADLELAKTLMNWLREQGVAPSEEEVE